MQRGDGDRLWNRVAAFGALEAVGVAGAGEVEVAVCAEVFGIEAGHADFFVDEDEDDGGAESPEEDEAAEDDAQV